MSKIERLVEQLQDSSEDVRKAARAKLVRLSKSDPDVKTVLLDRLIGTKDGRELKAVWAVLHRIDPEAAELGLVKWLIDRGVDSWRARVKGLSVQDAKRKVRKLVASLEDEKLARSHVERRVYLEAIVQEVPEV